MNSFKLTNSPKPLGRPNWRFVFSHPAHCIALGGGAGLFPRAPGTAGTALGWLIFVVLNPWMSRTTWGVFLGLAFLLGWWACTVTARHLHRPDPGCIVWDETWAFIALLWLCTVCNPVWPTPGPWPGNFNPSWLWQGLAFGLFRFFDAVKPFPVGWADRCLKGTGARGGLGVMWDDAVAALCAYGVLVGLQWLLLKMPA